MFSILACEASLGTILACDVVDPFQFSISVCELRAPDRSESILRTQFITYSIEALRKSVCKTGKQIARRARTDSIMLQNIIVVISTDCGVRNRQKLRQCNARSLSVPFLDATAIYQL